MNIRSVEPIGEAASEGNGSMATVNLTRDNFEKIVGANGIVLVDCWAAWCGACRDFDPVYDKVAAKHPSHIFGKVDAVDQKELISELRVDFIPTLLLYRDGFLLLRRPGHFEEDKLDDLVRQAESLDMDEIREQVEAEQEAQKGN